MKYMISFWLKHKGEEKDIFTIYDSGNNPFKKGMKFWVNIEMLYPRRINEWRKEWKEDFVSVIVDSNDNDRKILNNKRVKIISENITFKIDRNVENRDSIHVEYFVKYCPKFYWKWWYIKSLIKKLFK